MTAARSRFGVGDERRACLGGAWTPQRVRCSPFRRANRQLKRLLPLTPLLSGACGASHAAHV